MARPIDDLAFLERWHPIHERSTGDWEHRGDPKCGTWTVLRFPVQEARYKLVDDAITHGKPIPALHDPDVEAELSKHLSSGLFVVPKVVYPDSFGGYTEVIKSSNGGPDRFLRIAFGFYDPDADRINTVSGGILGGAYKDEYQVWIRDDSWFHAVWLNVKGRLGFGG
jgi:hypothetical protein